MTHLPMTCRSTAPGMVQPGTMVPSLVDTLELGEARCIAAIGGGGKTTALAAIARDFAKVGRSVLHTTTTRIWPPREGTVLIAARPQQQHALVAAAIGSAPGLTLASHATDEGKLTGIAASTVCDLKTGFPHATILVEADGSAGRPFKAHGRGEPVVPPCADVVLILVGMWAFGSVASDRTVHRLDWLPARTGLSAPVRLNAEVVARLVSSYRAHVPSRASVVVLLNGMDVESRSEHERTLEAALRTRWPKLQVTWTEYGHPVAASPEGL